MASRRGLREDWRYRHREQVAWRRLDGEAVVVDLTASEFFSLGPVGTLIWEKLGAGASVEQIELALCRSMALKPVQAREQLESLVRAFLKNRLICRR